MVEGKDDNDGGVNDKDGVAKEDKDESENEEPDDKTDQKLLQISSSNKQMISAQDEGGDQLDLDAIEQDLRVSQQEEAMRVVTDLDLDMIE